MPSSGSGEREKGRLVKKAWRLRRRLKGKETEENYYPPKKDLPGLL